jgi:hypothetical protein
MPFSVSQDSPRSSKVAGSSAFANPGAAEPAPPDDEGQREFLCCSECRSWDPWAEGTLGGWGVCHGPWKGVTNEEGGCRQGSPSVP